MDRRRPFDADVDLDLDLEFEVEFDTERESTPEQLADADASGEAPRTKRAREEPMQVTLACAGGRYSVYAASGRTYDVDIVEETCSCPDYRQNEPAGGCKHLRRTDMEIRAGRVPTPDGRVPRRAAADGGVTGHDAGAARDTTASDEGCGFASAERRGMDAPGSAQTNSDRERESELEARVRTPDDHEGDRISGPLTEFDKRGHPTGATYYRCRACGVEAMRERDLVDCCTERQS